MLLRLKYALKPARSKFVRIPWIATSQIAVFALFGWSILHCSQSTVAPLSSPNAQISKGWYFSCFLNTSGQVKCWGDASNGSLGYANATNIGDDETPNAVGYVDLGEPAVQIVSGVYHTCARLYSGRVLCWGAGNSGLLGSGNTNNIGDDELPSAGTYLTFPEPIKSLAAGNQHTCALSEAGNVYCWGVNSSGQLGYDHTNAIGDDEALPMIPVNLGGQAVQISAGASHTCVVLTDGGVKCWGNNQYGQLGQGNTTNVGDGIGPPVSALSEIIVGGTVSSVTAFSFASCALLTNGAVRCWGRTINGQLGYGNATQIGDDETPASAGDVSLGGTATQLSAGLHFVCALMSDGSVRCWGNNSQGQLGINSTTTIGDNEVPSSISAISLGGTAQSISCSKNSVPAQASACAVLTTGAVRCWGFNTFGQLGYGNTTNVGDGVGPSITSIGDVQL